MNKHLTVARRVFWLVPAAAVLLMGCGRGKGDITGEVSYKGEPISVGRITFLSQVGNNEVKSAHIIRGKYTIKGFPAGPVKISVESFEPPDKEILDNTKKVDIPAAGGMKERMKGPPPELLEMANGPPLKYVPIPQTYANPETSDLTYEVKKGSQTFDIPLKPGVIDSQP
jgi:hypothetical protein